MTALHIDVSKQTAERLDQFAEHRSQSREAAASDALEAYLLLQEEQIAEIKSGIDEANRGEFASDEQIEAILTKFAKLGS